MPISTIEGQSREEIAKALPAAIKAALDSYENFMANMPTSKASDFKSHHEAGKAAVAHIQLLTKLAEWVEAGQAVIGYGSEELREVLQKSAQDVKQYEDDENNNFYEYKDDDE